MKATQHLHVDRPIADSEKTDLLQFADQVEREGWIDTSLQLALAICLTVALAISGLRIAVPTASAQPDAAVVTQPAPAATTLAVGALETKVTPSL